MTLTPGSRIGPYEIGEPIGAGGMGEVFRARDLNLGRTAAIKVLPAALAGDPERLARFEREAQTLAALNHPNIAQVFGFEKGDNDFRALAMEFVDGPTLADRIATGPIPVDDAIAIAVQVAEALESAHDSGIIHRDLKPANVKVRPDGTVKVLDFGLAKAITPVSDASGLSANSPTLTTPAMTNAGVILGTAAYMSPEQAKGRVVDRRTDIWAFGCLLFEMLSGKRLFSGGDTSDVIVSILRDDPPWDALPASTPPHVRSLLRRCLMRDTRKRLPHIGEARLELTEPPAPLESAPGGWRTRWGVAVIIATMALLGVTAWTIWLRNASVEPSLPIRLRVELTADGALVLSGGVALSPDGKTLVFVGRPANSAQSTYGASLYVRHLDRLDAELLPGTESGQAPFFSPDGEWVAFFANETLKKVATNGGPVVSIAAAAGPRGGSWGDDGKIVFSSTDGLSRVPASGGKPEVIVAPSAGQPPPMTPQVLPNGRGILYVSASNSDPADGTVLVQDFAGGAPKEVLRGGRVPRYVASGHLTFVRSGTLLAAPFDLESLSTRGEAVPVVEGVFQAPVAALGNFTISDSGVLAYQPGGYGQQLQSPAMWLTEAGAMSPLRSAPSTFGFPRFSPDGRRLAMSITDVRQTDIWVYDYDRDILTRVTADQGADLSPVWLPDGASLIFGSNRGSNSSNLYWQRADGTGSAVRLTTSPVSQFPDSIDRQGRRLIVHEGDPATGRQSLTTLALDRDASGAVKPGTTVPLIAGQFLKANARISPDGKWFAYAANDTGLWEIYVQPFLGSGERVQVSNAGGNLAVWSATKSELYYVAAGSSRLMAVPYSVNGTAFVPTKPRHWAATMFSATPPLSIYGPGFDIHPDGRRFVVAPLPSAVADNPARSAQLIVVFNFLDELRRRAPTR